MDTLRGRLAGRVLGGTFLAYAALGFLGQSLVFRGTTVSPLWPAAGLGLGLVWRFPAHRGAILAGVAAGQFLCFGLGPLLKAVLIGQSFSISASALAFALVPALGAWLGGFTASWVFARRGVSDRLARPADVLTLVMGALSSALISAALGTFTLAASGVIPFRIFAEVGLIWVTGDWLGAVLLVPIFMRYPSTSERRRPKEAIAALVVTIVVSWVMFSTPLLASVNGVSGTYLCLMPLIWGALRLNSWTVSAQTLLVAATATLPTLRGVGPFAGFSTLNERLFSLQMFLAAESILTFLLVATEARRRSAEKERDAKEEQLVLARERAEQGSRAKSEFLTNMSHEIRTPLNGVLGAAELLSKSPLSEEQGELVRVIRASGEGLLSLLNDLLDLSKIEAGKMTLETRPFSIHALTTDAVGLFRAQVAPGVSLDVSVDPTVPPRLLGDSTRVRQILTNLVGNAVKFTQAGTIAVSLQSIEEEGAPRYCLEVRDSGVGIPEERIGALFRPFEQADASTARRHGGSGLGLAICKRLTEMMGGTISLSSKPGKGTTVRVVLPLAPAPMEPSPSLPSAEPLRASIRARVLLVEDNRINRVIATKMLEVMGASAAMAENGMEALERFDEGGWDLVLMDVQMPEMDGLTACREMRKREAARGQKALPIVALTANAREADRMACLEAGFDDFVTKPVKQEELRRVLSAYCGNGANAEDAANA